jgi:hypothetical protein
MKSLKRLGVSVTLICVLAMAAFAGEVSSPPCAPPEPGEVSSPPCSVAQITTDDAVPGDTNNPRPSNAADMPAISEVAIDLAQYWLSIF